MTTSAELRDLSKYYFIQGDMKKAAYYRAKYYKEIEKTL